MRLGDRIMQRGIQLDDSVEVKDDFLPLQLEVLESLDVILGVQWLETLGNVLSNWKIQVMQYEENGRTMTLARDPS